MKLLKVKSFCKFLLIFITTLFSQLGAMLDLNQIEHDFVLETKQIVIPEYPDAFNPSIVEWKGRLLMTFRARDPSTHLATLVGLTWLDKKFNPVGTPQLLQLPKEEVNSFYIQDPRLIVVSDKLYMAYSDLWQKMDSSTKSREMFIAEIDHDGVRFFARNRECFLNFEKDKNNKYEKNWVPFDYQGTLLLAYSLIPHKIFYPIQGKKKCKTIACTQGFNFWNWGQLRGGTPALLVDGYFLAFFHSSKGLSTVQSDGKSMPHYVMGAYLFEKDPPFQIKKISPKPISSPSFYHGPTYQTWKDLRVIFPCGFVYNEKYIWVSYGRQDHEAWIIKLDKERLFNSLIPFQSY